MLPPYEWFTQPPISKNGTEGNITAPRALPPVKNSLVDSAVPPPKILLDRRFLAALSIEECRPKMLSATGVVLFILTMIDRSSSFARLV